MNLRFQQRIMLSITGLIVVLLGITLAAVLGTVSRDVEQRLDADLRASGSLVRQSIESNADLLLRSANVLASDFGFKGAIASGDEDTIRSALDNHAERIDADVAGVILKGRDRLIQSSDSQSDVTAFLDVATNTHDLGQWVGMRVIAGEARQVVGVPVEAPLIVGWLVLGFTLDDEMARVMYDQVGMHVSFINRGGDEYMFGSSLPEAKRSSFDDAGRIERSSVERKTLVLDDEEFLTMRTSLGARSGIDVMLATSLEAALDGYRQIRQTLLILYTLALAAAFACTLWLAHGVTRPLALLSNAATHIRDGSYDQKLDWHRRDEFGELFDTFKHMQAGISEREATISHQAYHDDLTGLPNLRLINDRIDHLIELTRRSDEQVAVIKLGIARFNEVVDTLGHAVGDRLIKTLAERLQTRCRSSDSIARVATSEFVVVMPRIESLALRKVVNGLLDAVSRSIIFDSAEIVPRVSAGIAVTPQHADTATDALRRAGIALADAKERDLSICFYEFGRDESHRRRLSIVADLKRAVAKDELTLHYQPKIAMDTGAVESVEALVRWIHPEHGFMNPGEFIELAERSGNIRLLSNWVLSKAISQLAAWQQQGIDLAAAVNLSALDLQDETLPRRSINLLEAHGVKPSRLIIEVTESSMMRDTERAHECLGKLRERGLSVSVDDFGTGYSSLAQLRDLPIDELKIDRSFVTGIEPDSERARIIKAIIDLGHSLNLRIICEGIETRKEWDLLQAMGNDVVQGYLISKPLTADAFLPWWRDYHSDRDRAA